MSWRFEPGEKVTLATGILELLSLECEAPCGMRDSKISLKLGILPCPEIRATGGDLVMPAIAADVLKYNAAFYWHLGRGFCAGEESREKADRFSGIEKEAWNDFIENPIKPWARHSVLPRHRQS